MNRTRNLRDNPVLQCLMEMGTFDWTHNNTSLYVLSQAIRFSMALGSRFIPRIMALKLEVSTTFLVSSSVDPKVAFLV